MQRRVAARPDVFGNRRRAESTRGTFRRPDREPGRDGRVQLDVRLAGPATRGRGENRPQRRIRRQRLRRHGRSQLRCAASSVLQMGVGNDVPAVAEVYIVYNHHQFRYIFIYSV